MNVHRQASGGVTHLVSGRGEAPSEFTTQHFFSTVRDTGHEKPCEICHAAVLGDESMRLPSHCRAKQYISIKAADWKCGDKDRAWKTLC